LATALAQFPDLIYLDLSAAQGARSPHVLRQIGCLLELKVLKLRNCGLRDEDLDYLVVHKKLRSLDVSHNFLTERGISRLLELILAESLSNGRDHLSLQNASPVARRYSGIPLKTRVLAEGLEKFIFKSVTGSVDGYSQVEEGIPSTFTDFRLASNYITVDGLNKIFRDHTVQNLDCGTLNLSERPYEMLSPRSPGSSGSRRFSDPPEIEILSPALFCDSFRNLTSLRINHSVITLHPFSGKELPIAEQCFELHSEDLRFELDSKEVYKPGTLFEMEDTSKSITPEPEPEPETVPGAIDSPVPDSEKEKLEAELPKDEEAQEEAHAAFESPDDVAVQLKKTQVIDIKVNGSKGGKESSGSLEKTQNVPLKAIPPRISISVESNYSPTSHPVQATSAVPEGPEGFRYRYKSGTEAPWRDLEHRPKPSGVRELIEEVTQRQHRVCARERHPGRFKPSMLPNLKTLTLTDVPSSTRKRHTIDALALFIQECAEEEELARLEEIARLKAVNQSAPNDLSHAPLHRLRCLVLEMTSRPEAFLPPRSPFFSQQPKRASFTKSSTEDPDSEMFMSATESDFSFFGEDDGGLLVFHGRVDRPVAGNEGLMYSEADDGHLMDVIAELVNFRREKKRRFEALERFKTDGSQTDIDAELALLGHWRGEIKVVR
jgi:hypothetical protein